ncbi:MAG: carbonic anhydrase [Bdellovibrionaceae bacterium]|nr:carbonic anhydrase [Pseudobdellovibrionaceae bacterium]
MKLFWYGLFLIGISACALKPANEKETKVTVQSPATEPAAPALPPPPPAAPPSVTTPAAASHRHAGSVSASKALGWLKNGNIRFMKPSLRKDGQSATDRGRLTKGQYPHSIILSCSDSRVPPEVIFDQKLGEIFVVRVAGEVLDAASLASIEYGVEHLGSNLIVVLGHDSCGAVRAAHGTLDGSDAGSPWLNKLVGDIHPRLRSFAGKPLSQGGVVEGWANAEGVAKDLVQRSQIVRDAVNSGEVKIQSALYHLQTGEVDFK